VRMIRADSCVTVSSTWPARNMIPVSMIANRSAKNTGATRANSIAAEPLRSRRNRRSRREKEGTAGDGIEQSLAIALGMGVGESEEDWPRHSKRTATGVDAYR